VNDASLVDSVQTCCWHRQGTRYHTWRNNKQREKKVSMGKPTKPTTPNGPGMAAGVAAVVVVVWTNVVRACGGSSLFVTSLRGKAAILGHGAVAGSCSL